MSKARDLLESIRDRAEMVTVKNRAMDEAPMGITIADMTEDDQPLVYVNEGFEELTGYDSDEILGRNCRFLQGEETDPENVKEMRTAIENTETSRVELRNYRKDGTMFWNEVTLAPIFEGNEVPYYVGFQQDVTLRKEYEQQLETQRDDLDVLNQIVRHDIRNDLQVVLAALEVVEKTATEQDRPHIERALQSTQEAIELTRTARDISDVMLTAETEYHAIPLRETLSGQIEAVNQTYPDAVVEIYGTIPAVDIRADPMLESVFRNVLTNAIQHNDEETPRVTVSATAESETATVAIEDNGPGVPDDLKTAVFEKGVKGDDSETTGLGLYLVRRLVDNYGGEVSIEDAADKGTVVTIELTPYE
jgi:PAS domain S-box-containing protein